MVTLWTISPDTRSERRFDSHITIGQLKVLTPMSRFSWYIDS